MNSFKKQKTYLKPDRSEGVAEKTKNKHYLEIKIIFSPFTVEVKVDGKPHWVTICDTAGQDVLDPLRQLCYPDCSVVMLCFSVVKPETFKSIKDKWTPEVSNLPGAALLLVGTHSDLRNDKQVISRLQVIFN